MRVSFEYVRPDQLKPAEYNPRKIDEKALAALAGILDQHGFVSPVIARRADGLIIGGHQRIKANALREQPDERVPCIWLDGIDDDQAKALNVALNNPEAQGHFETELLADMLASIQADSLDLAAATGFSPDQLADLAAATGELEPLNVELPQVIDVGPDKVTVILEIPQDVYVSLRRKLDDLVATHALTCHVRMGD